MKEFKPGDRVRRMLGCTHFNMKIGDIGTVDKCNGTVLKLKEYSPDKISFYTEFYELVTEENKESEVVDNFQIY